MELGGQAGLATAPPPALAGRVRKRPEGALQRSVPIEKIQLLDARLAEVARSQSRIRLALGEFLEAFAKHGSYHEMGFSSFEAYARERCGRSGRWASESRTLARRLSELPRLRGALASGAVGWCMAELVARHATPESDAELTELALRSTVQQMRGHFAKRAEVEPNRNEGQEELAGSNWVEPEDLELCTLTVGVTQQDAWLFEFTRRFLEHSQAEVSDEQVVGAMLAEAFTTLIPSLPANDLDAFTRRDFRTDPEAARENAWRAQLAAWREESELRCASRFDAHGPGGEVASQSSDIGTIDEILSDRRGLDARIRECAAQLATREVELARLARQLHAAQGWLRLGYASEEQYARERLGLSASSFKAKIALARRWGKAVRSALEHREIGYESALLISRVCTPETESTWIVRAQARTVKHLAEDVRVAELVRSIGGDAMPPTDEIIQQVHALESRVLGGDRAAVIEARSQMSARLGAKPGTLRIRLRLTKDTARFWRMLEHVTMKHLPREISFLAFLCECFWDAWKHLTNRDEKWAGIYKRDRYQCANPVCRRHDVTCHHIVFRSAGGGDEPENLIALCTWCHLEGIHTGKIRLQRTEDGLRWLLGREATIVVEGREYLTSR